MDGLESDEEFLLVHFNLEDALKNSRSDTSLESFSDSNCTSRNSSDFVSTRTWCSVNSNIPAPPSFPFTAIPKVNLDIDSPENLLQFFEEPFDDSAISIFGENHHTQVRLK